jgi:biofilm PGA synthesis N-glycosyltransferase PgaC
VDRDTFMDSKHKKYIVITPVRDEEAYLSFTAESILQQTILPLEWIIVNDGSTDGTPEIINKYVRQHSWIKRVDRENRGYRMPGAGIIQAFYDGYNSSEHRDWDFMAKLDGDISFGSDYFERLFSCFADNRCLGIAGGTLYHIKGGKIELEACPIMHVRGGAKVFRRSCWEAIGGLWVGYGSDTIDEVTANMLGWETKSIPSLLMQHHRQTGKSYGKWGAMVKDGKADYTSGYHPLFQVAKCISRLRKKPYIIGALGLLGGFLCGYFQRLPRVNKELRKYVRREQMARLCGRQTIWK